MDIRERTLLCGGSNIAELRKRHPEGLHFVVGDTHGQVTTLKALMDTVEFDPSLDHVYFVGDYNGGGDVHALLRYMAQYYQADYSRPGFHMIRGNHEWELLPTYPLENLPDILVLRQQNLTYYLVHAGMVSAAFDLINADIQNHPRQKVFAYRVDPEMMKYDAPLRQLIWSRKGLYSQRSPWHTWPSEQRLAQHNACVIHGHAPYCFFKKEEYYSYGHNNLFWQKQHIYFSEDLQSFNIDANVKGRYANGENHRGLACICLEVIEEIAARNQRHLTVEGVKSDPDFVFSADLVFGLYLPEGGDIRAITAAYPEAKKITLDEYGELTIIDDRPAAPREDASSHQTQPARKGDHRMHGFVPLRPGDARMLAFKFIHTRNMDRVKFDVAKLDHPDELVADNILAVHYADSGAQGDAGAVRILYNSPQGVQILYGNYAYGGLDLDAVIRKLPMLKSLDSRYMMTPPYPFGGSLDIPKGWGYLYMGAMNHFFVSEAICARTEAYVKHFLDNGGERWQVFEAIAWLCRAR